MKQKQGLHSMSDKTSDIVLVVATAIIMLIIAYPLYYVIVASVSDPYDVYAGKTFLLPSKFTLEGYKAVFSNSNLLNGFINSVKYTVIGTLYSVITVYITAYPLSKKDLPGRKWISIFFIITMYFGGGLIPTYLLISNLGMLDTIWAILLPGAFSVWNMIIARTYYQGIPQDLQEAAEIDGANEMVYFFKVLLPVCTPIIATIAMWQFVGMWNSYFDAMIYLNSPSKQPLQLVLRSILIQNQPEPGMVSDMQSTAERAQLAELLKYATIIISSLPLMIMYPFFQKYFDNGIMAGAVKG